MEIIKASEIGEFYYCCVAWYLGKTGVKQQRSTDIEKKLKDVKTPEEKIKLEKELQISKTIEQKLEKGVKRHEEMGKQIAYVEVQEKQINYLKYIGYVILVLIVIGLIFALIK